MWWCCVLRDFPCTRAQCRASSESKADFWERPIPSNWKSSKVRSLGPKLPVFKLDWGWPGQTERWHKVLTGALPKIILAFVGASKVFVWLQNLTQLHVQKGSFWTQTLGQKKLVWRRRWRWRKTTGTFRFRMVCLPETGMAAPMITRMLPWRPTKRRMRAERIWVIDRFNGGESRVLPLKYLYHGNQKKDPRP